MEGTILVATAGQGVLRSSDDGATWYRLGLGQDLEFDAVVRCLAVHPEQPERRLRRRRRRASSAATTPAPRWHRVDSPMNDQTDLVAGHRPQRPGHHASPVPAHRPAPPSTAPPTAAPTWDRLPPQIPEFCAGRQQAPHPDRDLSTAYDAQERLVRHRGGRPVAQRRPRRHLGADRRHTRRPAAGRHQLRRPLRPRPRRAAEDDRRRRRQRALRQPGRRRDLDPYRLPASTWGIYYTRLVRQLPGTNDLLLGIGDGTPGTTTRILRSDDLGRTWQDTVLDTPANSTVWAFGTHAADPELVFAGTKYGHLLRSTDGGRTWRKEWREFSEITDVAWTPAVAPPAGRTLNRWSPTSASSPRRRQPTPIPARSVPCSHECAVPTCRCSSATPRPRPCGTRTCSAWRSPHAARSGCSCPSGAKHHDIALIRAEEGADAGRRRPAALRAGDRRRPRRVAAAVRNAAGQGCAPSSRPPTTRSASVCTSRTRTATASSSSTRRSPTTRRANASSACTTPRANRSTLEPLCTR